MTLACCEIKCGAKSTLCSEVDVVGAEWSGRVAARGLLIMRFLCKTVDGPVNCTTATSQEGQN